MEKSRLIVAIGEGSWGGGAARAAGEVLDMGADLVELRGDLLGEEEMAGAANWPGGRWVATLRTVREGGKCGEDWGARWKQLQEFVEKGAGAFDVEYADLRGDQARVKEVAALAARSGCQPIVSAHVWEGEGGTAALRELPSMEAVAAGAVGKVAWSCTDVRENFAAAEAMRQRPGRRIVVCMGEKGVLSRVLGAKFGAWGTFCALGGAAPTAPGQITLTEMLERYRWREQRPETPIFGVIGSPVAQSMSPAVFNDHFGMQGIDGVYVPLRIDTGEELRGFLDGCRERLWFGARGFSVTVPHKAAALEWAGENVDPRARRIGAANTLAFRPDGGVHAANTDYSGALAALGEGMKVAETDFDGLSAAVLGAGGVARAVVAGLRDRGCRVTIYNRSAARAEALAGEFGCRAAPWERRVGLDADVVINCTSVGMVPDVEESPLPVDALRPTMTVFDTVYNPCATRLLRDARAVGCRTIDGVAMFVHQAAEQYRLWIGRDADVSRMRAVVMSALAAREQASRTTHHEQGG